MVAFASISQQLLQFALTIEEAVYELRGEDSLLRWFACDCAEHILAKTKEHSIQLDVRSSHVLEIARQIAVGHASEAERLRAAYAAGDAARSEPSGLLDAARATVEISASYAAMAAAEAAGRAASLYGLRHKEIVWQRHRLAYLCDVWSACGHRAHWLLLEGKCPMEPSPEAELLR